MKDDHQDEKQDGEKTLQGDGGQIELEKSGDQKDDTDDADTDEDKPGGPILEPDEKDRNHDCNDGNIQDILKSQGVQYR